MTPTSNSISEQKIYSIFKKELEIFLAAMLILGVGIAVFQLAYYITRYFFEYEIVFDSVEIGFLPTMFLPFLIYKSIMLRFYPLFIINETEIRYFNVLWYNTLSWKNMVKGAYILSTKELHIHAVPAMRVNLSIISDEDAATLLHICETQLKKQQKQWLVSEVEVEEIIE
jgi:hypothetical protein